MSNANALMKGHTWAKGKHKLKWPAVAEFKYDEIRLDVRAAHGLMGTGILFQSFADKPLHNLGDYAERFKDFMCFNNKHRLDMGVLVNESFNDTYRWTRSKNGAPEDLHGARVSFILFDDPHLLDAYQERVHLLDGMADEMRRYGLPVIRPERTYVEDEQAVFDLYGRVREQGYEGLMVKDTRHFYQLGKRTYGWLKVKPEEDADGIITAINQATSIEGVPLDRAGSVTIAVEDGSTADCAGIDHDLGRLMLAHPEQFIGKWAEFKYMERDRQGGYRHPRFNRIREDKA